MWFIQLSIFNVTIFQKFLWLKLYFVSELSEILYTSLLISSTFINLGFPDAYLGRYCYLTCGMLIWLILYDITFLEKYIFQKALLIWLYYYFHQIEEHTLPCICRPVYITHRTSRIPVDTVDFMVLIPRRNMAEMNVQSTKIQDIWVLVSALPQATCGIENSCLFPHI